VLKLERLWPDDREWSLMDSFDKRVVFQTREWVEFIASTTSGEPVVAAVRDGTDVVGYFSGVVVTRFGVRILGSPLRGWSTWYMGFNLRDGVARRDAVEALVEFAFDDLRCLHLELRDRQLSAEDVRGLGVDYVPTTILEVDLRPSEEEIFGRMTSACRRCVRKAEKTGVTIEEAQDPAFGRDYYEQLKEVFARQRLVPSYNLDRVEQLMGRVGSTGRLLLLRARDPDGTCIATGIFPAMNGTMYFWGGASWRRYQILRPNEAIMWHAMRYWKARGIESCDLGGPFPSYKTKFGPREAPVITVMVSRYRALAGLRNVVRVAYEKKQRIAGSVATLRG
jgi:hypothetical protein